MRSRAEALGLVHDVVPAAELDAAVERRLAELQDFRAGGGRRRESAHPRGRGRDPEGRHRPDDRPRSRPSASRRRARRACAPSSRSASRTGPHDDPAACSSPIAARSPFASSAPAASAGIESVAVYSDADGGARARHARPIAPCGSAPRLHAESYLSIPAADRGRAPERRRRGPSGLWLPVGECRLRAGLCEHAGLIFIGPPADVIERMGSKIGARTLMAAAGVPVVPGLTPADQDDAGLLAAVGTIGYPVLVKASAGGGGKGMRVVRDAAAAGEAIGAARREAAVGIRRRHALRRTPDRAPAARRGPGVLPTTHGNVVHLFERECSVQRRHQKVIEESPSPALTPALRERDGARGGRGRPRRRLSQCRHDRVPARRQRRRSARSTSSR